MIEVLVVIAIIGVLLGISVPALERAKTSAMELAVTNHQRQVGAELRHYMDDHDDWFPHYAEAGADEAYLDYPPNDTNPDHYGTYTPEDGAYWGQTDFWWWVLETEGYDGAMARRGPEIPPGWDLERRPDAPAALDTLTYTAFVTNQFFSKANEIAPGVVWDDTTKHTPRRGSDVEYPSNKGLLLRRDHIGDTFGVSSSSDAAADIVGNITRFIYFADGHTELLKLEDLIPGMGLVDDAFFNPVLRTKGGLGGRDR